MAYELDWQGIICIPLILYMVANMQKEKLFSKYKNTCIKSDIMAVRKNYIYITETFSRHPYIIYTSLYFECFILKLQTTHFFVVFSYVHLKQISHRKAIKSFIQSHISVLYFRSGQMVRWYWANFRGILLVWIKVGQGPATFAVGSNGGCFDVCFLSSVSSHFFLPPSRRRPDTDRNNVSKGR